MLQEYKGIKRTTHPKWDGWYWLDVYCKNHNEKVLDNDIVLAEKVKTFYLKKRAKVILFNLLIWGGLIYLVDTLTKG